MRFQRCFLCLTSVILVIFMLTSCGNQGKTADDIAFKLLNLYPSLPPCTQYIKNGEKFMSGYISPEDFAFLYLGERVVLPEWELIDEFRIIMSDNTEFFELHVIKAESSADSDELRKLLERRKRLIELYIKEENDFPIVNAEIYIKGRFLVLVATDDNRSAVELLRKLL